MLPQHVEACVQTESYGRQEADDDTFESESSVEHFISADIALPLNGNIVQSKYVQREISKYSLLKVIISNGLQKSFENPLTDIKPKYIRGCFLLYRQYNNSL